jgi:hypothetical protein
MAGDDCAKDIDVCANTIEVERRGTRLRFFTQYLSQKKGVKREG